MHDYQVREIVNQLAVFENDNDKTINKLSEIEEALLEIKENLENIVFGIDERNDIKRIELIMKMGSRNSTNNHQGDCVFHYEFNGKYYYIDGFEITQFQTLDRIIEYSNEILEKGCK